jgi:hypothetical protein
LAIAVAELDRATARTMETQNISMIPPTATYK